MLQVSDSELVITSVFSTEKSRFSEWPPSANFDSLNRDFTFNQDSFNRDFTL